MLRELLGEEARGLTDEALADAVVAGVEAVDGRVRLDWPWKMGRGARLSESEEDELLAVELGVLPPSGDPREWVELLCRSRRVGAVSILETDASRRGWDWPLDVAVWRVEAITGAEHAFLRREARLDHGSLVELLLVPPADEAVGVAPPMLLPPIHSVVCLGMPASTRGELHLLRTLRSRWRADTAVAVAVGPEDRAKWLGALTRELAHDRPLDEALFTAAREAGAPRPLLCGRAGAFANARLGTHAENALAAIERRTAARAGLESMSPPSSVRSEAAALLERVRGSRAATFKREIWGAKNVADVATGFEAEERTREARAVHADLRRAGERVEHLTLDSPHTLDVQIRPRRKGVAADVDFTAPPDWKEGETHYLQVFFQDLTSPVTERKAFRGVELVLPPSGPSSVASLPFTFGRTVEPTTEFRARLLVIEPPARVLQTLDYRVDVGEQREAPRLRVETSPRELDALDGPRSDVPFAFVVNQNAAAQHILASIQNGHGIQVPLASFRDLVGNLSKALDSFADGQKYGDGIKNETSRQLLRRLADEGVQLREALEVQWGSLGTAARIQLISADVNFLVPLEVCYDGVAPKRDAPICEVALRKLKSPKARRGAAREVCTCGSTADVVCPLRFWGLSRIIERHGPNPEWTRALGQVVTAMTTTVTAAQRIDVSGPVLWAMDEVVDNDGKGGTLRERKRLEAALKKRLPKRLLTATSWGEWEARVVKAPGVVAAVVHHDDAAGDLVLNNDRRPLGRVNRELVGDPDKGALPLILLLGCSTQGGGKSSFQPAFRFKVAGVPAVVGTQSPVIGRFAAKCAWELVEALRAQAEERAVPLGEVLRLLRGRMVAKGLTTAMSLVAIGDADRLIGKEV
jgi:hypothetical protein